MSDCFGQAKHFKGTESLTLKLYMIYRFAEGTFKIVAQTLHSVYFFSCSCLKREGVRLVTFLNWLER